MPVIVYKTSTLHLCYVQVRRIQCEFCSNPFCYVWSGTEMVQVTGIPIVSSDESMQKNVQEQAEKSLNAVSKKPKQGEAMCPHCHRYQSWMAWNSHFSEIGCFSLVGLGLAGLLGFIGIVMEFVPRNTEGLVMIGSLIFGLIVGIAYGKSRSITEGPHPDLEDHRAFKDDEFKGWLAQCMEKELDPFLAWWGTLGGDPGEHALVSLGFHDTARPMLFPPEEEGR